MARLSAKCEPRQRPKEMLRPRKQSQAKYVDVVIQAGLTAFRSVINFVAAVGGDDKELRGFK